MIRRCYVSFAVPQNDGPRLLELLRGIGCADGWQEPYLFVGRLTLPSYSNTLDEEDPRLAILRSALTQQGIKWSERIDHVYTDAELRELPLLRLGVDREPIYSEGIEYGTRYDMSSACPHCGTGAVQSSALLMPLNALPKKGQLCATCRGDVLVGKELAQAFGDAKVSGVELRQVRFYRNSEPLPWWQIISGFEMPRLSKRTKGIARDVRPGFGCTVCERDVFAHFGDEPAERAYDRSAVDYDRLPDVVHSWECYGRSVLEDDPVRKLVRGFALPNILVKPKVFDIIRGVGDKHECFEPVRFVD